MSDATDRIPYDVHGHLEEPMDILGMALDQWVARDETRAQPHVSRAAHKAVDAIDTMLRELHLMRDRLTGEIRDANDASEARRARLLDGPGLVCPGCGSPDVDLSRGLLCGTCAAAAAEEAGDD
jgi:hypothetical protein